MCFKSSENHTGICHSHRNRKGVGPIPAEEPIVDDEFFSTVCGFGFRRGYDFHPN